MNFFLVHIDDRPEATVLVPGEEPLAVIAPLAELGDLLHVLRDTCAELEEQRCPACGEALPGRSPRAEAEAA